jgi:hypothetical protein
VLVAFTLSLLLGPARAASAAPVAITEAPSLHWGFKLSWRVYAGAPAVSGGATVLPDTSPAAHDLGWAFDSGSFDADTGTTILKYKGTAHWTGHNSVAEGWLPPPGYDGPLNINLLDVTLTDPVVTISRDTATISAEGISRNLDTWRLVDYGRVALVNLAADETTPVLADGATIWSAIRATSAAEGGSVFGGTYPSGTDVDRVGLSYTGPGGAPDFSEDFDAPGTVRLAPDGDNVLLTPADTPNGSYETFAVDPARQLVHYRVRSTLDGADAWTYQAFDLTTMQEVGAPLTLAASAFGAILLEDSSSGKLYASSDTEGYPRHWIRFDRDLGAYVQGDSAEPIPAANDNSTLAWDPVGQRAFEVTRVLADGTPAPRDDYDTDGHRWQLRTYTEQPDGTWATKGYDLPNHAPNLNYSVYQRLGVAAGDGSLILFGDAQFAWPDESVVAPEILPGAYRVVTHDDGTADVTPVPGSEVSNAPLGQYTTATAGPDGTVALVNANGSTTVQRMDVTPADGEIRAGAVVDAGFANADVQAVAVDPEDGTVWLAGLKSRRIVGVNGGRIVADQVLALRNTREPALVAGPGHTLFMQSNDGGDDNLQQHASGFQKLKRAGVSPTVGTAPRDAAVALGAGVDAQDVTFSAGAAGKPEPSLQWQVKPPGATRFRDINNETGAALTVAARPGMDGTLYRAVFANAGGRIATAPATLGVAYAPQVRIAPVDASVAPGQDATFEVVGVGHPEPTVEWQYRVGGFWQTVEPDNDDFRVEPGRLVVKNTNLDQSGTLVRARLRNSVATVATRTATLTIAAPQPRSLTGVRLDWTGSPELQRRAPNRTASYFSAGDSDGTEATYAASARGVRVLQVAAGGAEQAASWATRDQHLTSGGSQVVRLVGGTGTIAADGSTRVSWAGTFTVNMYGGLVPFTVSAPSLALDPDGDGTLVATLSGYSSSQADPDARTPIAPVAGVTLATFSGGRIDPSAPSTITPNYAGVETELPAGQVQQVRSGESWGAWPQSFVDFHGKTGLGSYWYSSGGAADPYKVAAPIVVTVTGESDPEPAPAAPAPGSPAVAGTGTKAKAKALAPKLGTARATRTVNRRTGTAVITTLTCRTGPCRVTRAASVRFRIAGRISTARLTGAKTIAGGRAERLAVRLPRTAIARLKGHRATVTVPITVRSPAGTTTRTYRITLR